MYLKISFFIQNNFEKEKYHIRKKIYFQRDISELYFKWIQNYFKIRDKIAYRLKNYVT